VYNTNPSTPVPAWLKMMHNVLSCGRNMSANENVVFPLSNDDMTKSTMDLGKIDPSKSGNSRDPGKVEGNGNPQSVEDWHDLAQVMDAFFFRIFILMHLITIVVIITLVSNSSD